jgi:murein DD-endopeptidase MepM/ murein hydrolase activator NlpD
VLAPAAGVVVKVHNRERDHRSRNSPLGFLLLFLEMSVRELLGIGRVLGNHVALDLGGGVYAVLAHLRRGSMRVDGGERVRPGEPVAECGNSGNSSEPHLHFQLMDSEHVLFAAGLPLEFESLRARGKPAARRSRQGTAVRGAVLRLSAAASEGT